MTNTSSSHQHTTCYNSHAHPWPIIQTFADSYERRSISKGASVNLNTLHATCCPEVFEFCCVPAWCLPARHFGVMVDKLLWSLLHSTDAVYADTAMTNVPCY